MQVLTQIWMTLSLDLDTYLKWELLARVAPCKSIVDIEICKILTDLNVTDPLTKIISQAKHDHTLVLFGC